MKLIKNSSGTEGAENSSTQKNSASDGPSTLYQNSLYVAAIAKCMGYEGLDHALTTAKNEVEYAFDFYHRQSKTLIKVFRGDALSDYPRYAKYPGNLAILIDVEHADGPVGWSEHGGDMLLTVPKEIGDVLNGDRRPLLYYEHHLWELSGKTDTGRWIWRAIEPAVLVQMGLLKR